MRATQLALRGHASALFAARRSLLSSTRFATSASSSSVRSSAASNRIATLPTAALQRRAFLSTSSSAKAAVTDEPEPDITEDDADGNVKPPVTDQYASLKPYVNYDTWKALTNKPFHFKTMSEVQQRVLSLLPALADPQLGDMPDGEGGRDLLVKAKTGTGKTVAFLVPAIERRLRAIYHAERGRFTAPWQSMLEKQRPDLKFEELDKHGRIRIRRQFCLNTAGVLVLSPTRELATQIATEAKKLCHYHDDFNVQLLVGGASRSQQLREFSRTRPDIIVATPGRLIDMLKEESLVRDPLSAVQTLIYDEADTLLDMGFRDDIQQILTYLPKAADRLTMLFSATVGKQIKQIAAQSLLPDHRFIDCVPAGEDNVHQHIPQFATVLDDPSQQLVHLGRLIALDQLRNAGNSKVIVFSPTTKMTQLLADRFVNGGLKASLPAGTGTHVYELHSKKEAEKRFRISNSFREDKSGASVMFTSDVSARGVDYPGTTRVIQVGMAPNKDQYIHRIGRTGRAGAQGTADIILQPFEAGFLKRSLGELPIQPRTVQDTKQELEELCNKFDEDPTSVVEPLILKKMERNQPLTDKRGKRLPSYLQSKGVASFRAPLSERLCSPALDDKVADVVERADKEEVENNFMSFLGFYIGHISELGTSQDRVVAGLKEWAVAAADLDRPPYVSEAFLKRLGVNDRNSRPRKKFDGPNTRTSSFTGRDRGRFGGDRKPRFDGEASGYGGKTFARPRPSNNVGQRADRFF